MDLDPFAMPTRFFVSDFYASLAYEYSLSSALASMIGSGQREVNGQEIAAFSLVVGFGFWVGGCSALLLWDLFNQIRLHSYAPGFDFGHYAG